MAGSDYSGWGGDDKGSPMVVVSPGASNDGGGGRTTMILLVTALVFALGIAGWALITLNTSNVAHQKELNAKDDQLKVQVAKLNTDLGAARALVDAENAYTDKLEADNSALEKNAPRAKLTPPPEPTQHQRVVVILEKRNAALRAGKPAPVITDRIEDPLKPRPTR